MLSDVLNLLLFSLRDLPLFALSALSRKIQAIVHHYSYKPLAPEQTRNVIVIGGSFTGYQTAKCLTETLPTGYRVVLIEKNSHFNYVFAFPRFSVLRGYERYAFIPYVGLGNQAPGGIFELVQARVDHVDERVVRLECGKSLEYDYLVIATGTSSRLPSKVAATESLDGQRELKGMQNAIKEATRIAIVGGGAVGVELASDIKDFYPDKSIVLVQSRDRLLPSFGERLQQHVTKKFHDMGIAIWLNERPMITEGSNSLKLKRGQMETFDLVIPCTGQRPNSSIISTLSPGSISQESSHILVRPSLQIADKRYPNIFAAGDVAASGGPKMARAGFMQSFVVVDNILALIKGNSDMKVYKPMHWLEGSIKLTLGKQHLVLYTNEFNRRHVLFALDFGIIDMDTKRQWRHFGADPSQAEAEAEAQTAGEDKEEANS